MVSHPAPGSSQVQRDPRLEPGPFRWPDDRPPLLPGDADVPGSAQRGLDYWIQTFLLTAGILGSLWIYLAPLPDGLSIQGKTAFAIWLLCTTLWITHFIPYGVTALLAVALIGLSGAMKPSEAYAAFGSAAVFFLIGVFLIAGALVQSGLSKRFALMFLRRFEGSPYAFANAMMYAAAIGTIFMPNQATTAMLFPIAMEVAAALRLKPKQSNYAKVLFFSLGWGAMVGSNTTFLGSSRAALALGMLQKNSGVGIGFLEWTRAAFPITVVGVLIMPVVLRHVFKPEEIDFSAARGLLEKAVADLGPMKRQQWITLGVILLTIGAWIAVGGRRVDLATIALLGAVLLFVTGVLKWQEAERSIYWNVVLMYGGAIALAVLIDKSGATGWLLTHALDGRSVSPFVAIAGAGVVSLVLSEVMSHVAAIAAILPMAFTLGGAVGASPVAITLATSFGAGLDFIFPISSAPNTMIFASGYLRAQDYVKAGVIMTVVLIITLVLVIRFWWPVIGLR